MKNIYRNDDGSMRRGALEIKVAHQRLEVVRAQEELKRLEVQREKLQPTPVVLEPSEAENICIIELAGIGTTARFFYLAISKRKEDGKRSWTWSGSITPKDDDWEACMRWVLSVHTQVVSVYVLDLLDLDRIVQTYNTSPSYQSDDKSEDNMAILDGHYFNDGPDDVDSAFYSGIDPHES